MAVSLASRLTPIFVFLASSLWVAEGICKEEVSHMDWDGVGIYHAVDREVIQKKLDDFFESSVNGCNRPRLYLPDTHVFPDIISPDQHVAYFDFGINVHFLDFDDLPSYSVVAVAIPFLSDHPSNPPKYSLALGKLYQKDIPIIPTPNIAFPYIPIDEVTITDDGAILRNGTEEMRVAYTRYTDPCLPAPKLVRHEFEDFIDVDMQMGAAEPNFDICDIEPHQNNEFCSIVVKGIRCGISRVAPNFCQSSWKSDDMVFCKTTVEELSVTPGFRDFMLMGEDPVTLVATQSNHGHHNIGVKFPCID